MTAEPKDHRTTWLFARFAAIYGQKWLKPLDDDMTYRAAVNEWGKAIAALSPQQVARGVEESNASLDDWPPSIPGFLRRALGLPDPTVAASNAIRMASDPLSKEIRSRAGAYRVRMASESEAMSICRAVYADLVHDLNARVLSGQPVDPVALLEQPTPIHGPREIDANRNLPAESLAHKIPLHLQGKGA